MGKKTVDEYISSSEFWRAELIRLRDILRTTPLSEAVKWGAPCYLHKGKNVVGLVAFKTYVGLWFYQGALLSDDKKVLMNAQAGKTKAQRQWRMHSAADIRPTLIKRYVKEAMQLIDGDRSIGPAKAQPLRVPAELQDALRDNKAIEKMFVAMPLGKRREYADYVAAAKREATRLRRAAKVLPMIKAGVGLNDRYRS